MKPDAFARIVREGTAQLRADKVIIADANGVTRFRGVGVVRISRDRIEIELTIRGSGPAHRSNILTKKDYWRLSGVIDDDLRFSSGFVTPISTSPGFKGALKITRTLHILELVTKRVDPVRIRRNQRALYRRLKVSMPRRKRGNDRSFSFHATLVDHPLPGANAWTEIVRINEFLPKRRTQSGDTFLGETSAGQYALIRANNERDLDVYLRSTPDFQSLSEQDDQRKFQALLHGLAFATGIQPWPFRTKYSRGAGYVISDTLRAPEPSPRTLFAPFRETVGSDDGEPLAQAIRAAADFLEPDTRFNRKLLYLLFLFRQAGRAGAQTEITVLMVCTLVESLVREIFNELCVKKSAFSDALDPTKFERLKESFVRRVSRRSERNKGREYERLFSRIRDCPLHTTGDVFKAVAQRLDISWKSQMEPIYAEWKKARHPSAHGNFRHGETQPSEEPFLGLSRVAGGFNMILLKLFGYKGPYIASIVEGPYGEVKRL